MVTLPTEDIDGPWNGGNFNQFTRLLAWEDFVSIDFTYFCLQLTELNHVFDFVKKICFPDFLIGNIGGRLIFGLIRYLSCSLGPRRRSDLQIPRQEVAIAHGTRTALPCKTLNATNCPLLSVSLEWRKQDTRTPATGRNNVGGGISLSVVLQLCDCCQATCLCISAYTNRHVFLSEPQSGPVLSNVFIYWGASDWWLWRCGRPVAIAIIIIITPTIILIK
jgi:hypothetical protein